MNENNSIKSGINGDLCGFYKVQCVNPRTGEVVSDYGWNKNLILNTGMDLVATNIYPALTNYCIAGTGSRMNFITGGFSTITQSGNLITLWPSSSYLLDFSSSITSSTNILYYTHSLEVGDVIVYANASQSNVTAIDTVGGLTASVDTSYTIESGSNQTFTIWKTSQTRLHSEKKRSNTYLIGVGNCGVTNSTGSNGKPNVRTFRRTYDFTAETSNSLYTEIGTSPVVTANTSVFSRILLPVPIAISTSLQLRVIYDLQVTYTPELPRYFTASISGWPNTICTESLQLFSPSGMDTSGNSSTAALDPAATSEFPGTSYISNFTSPSSASLAAFGSAVDRTTNYSFNSTETVTSYVIGSYALYKVGSFGLNVSNRTDIRSIGMGLSTFSGQTPPARSDTTFICVLFNETQSKVNTQTLSFTWKFSWSRTLS